jgi:hypothetical protein
MSKTIGVWISVKFVYFGFYLLVYANGTYQSTCIDMYFQNIDIVVTGIQGAASRYDLEIPTKYKRCQGILFRKLERA